ncbi:MAG: hypothetical protein J6Y39_01130 [Bacteroidaceae bacterium]|nr:hypothetical protein [Bacteroidaceae bacterium]
MNFVINGTTRVYSRLVLVNDNIGYGINVGENEIFSGTYKLIYLSSDMDAIKLANYEDGNLDDLVVCYTKETLTAEDMYDADNKAKHIYYSIQNVTIPGAQKIGVKEQKSLTKEYTVQLTYSSSQATEIGETVTGKLTGLPDMMNPITNEVQGSALAVTFTAQKASDNGTKAVYKAKITTLPLTADGVQLITNFDHNSYDIQISNTTITTK